MLTVARPMLSPRPPDAELEAGERDRARRAKIDEQLDRDRDEFMREWTATNAPPPMARMSRGVRAGLPDQSETDARAEQAYRAHLAGKRDELRASITAKALAATEEVVKPMDGEPPEALAARRKAMAVKVLARKGIAVAPEPDNLTGDISMLDEMQRSGARLVKSVAKVPGNIAQVGSEAASAWVNSPASGVPRFLRGPLGAVYSTIGAAGAALNNRLDTVYPDEGLQPSSAVQREGAMPDSLSSVPRWLAARGPETAGSLATTMIPGAAAMRAGGAAAGMAVAMGSGAALETSGAYDDAMQGNLSQGVPAAAARREAAVEALAYGAVSTVLEKFPAAELLLRNREARAWLTRTARAAFAEGSTEATQELAQALTQVIGGSAPDALKDIGGRMMASGVLGGVAGAGAGTVMGHGPSRPTAAAAVSKGQPTTLQTIPRQASSQTPQVSESESLDVSDLRAALESGLLPEGVDTETLRASLQELGIGGDNTSPIRKTDLSTPTTDPGAEQASAGPEVGTRTDQGRTRPLSSAAPARSSPDASSPSLDDTTDVPDFLADVMADERGQADAPGAAPGGSLPPPTAQPDGGVAPAPPVPPVRPGSPDDFSTARLMREVREGTADATRAVDDSLSIDAAQQRAEGGARTTIQPYRAAKSGQAMADVREGFSTASPQARALMPDEQSLGDVNKARRSAEWEAYGKAGRDRAALDIARTGGGSPQARLAAYELGLRTDFGPPRRVTLVPPDAVPVGSTFDISGQTHRVEERGGGKGFVGVDGSFIPVTGTDVLRTDAGTFDPSGQREGNLNERAEVESELPLSPGPSQAGGRIRGAVSRVNRLLAARFGPDARIMEVRPKSAADRQAVAVGRALGLDVVLFEREGNVPAEGMYDPASPRTVFIEAGREGRNIRKVVGHEWVHSLRRNDPAAFRALAEGVEKVQPGRLSELVRSHKDRLRKAGLPGERVNAASMLGLEEAVAELMTQRATDIGFWSKLAGDTAGVWERIVDALRRVVARLTPGARGREARLLLRTVERAGRIARAGGTAPSAASGADAELRLSPASQDRDEATARRVAEVNAKAQTEPDGKRTIGDPRNRANPATDEKARRLVDAARWVNEQAAKKRQARSDAQVLAEAQQALRDPAGVERKLAGIVAGTVSGNDTDVTAARLLENDAANRALSTNDLGDMVRFVRIGRLYDAFGTRAGQTLRAFHDWAKTPAERQAAMIHGMLRTTGGKSKPGYTKIDKQSGRLQAELEETQRRLDDVWKRLNAAELRAEGTEDALAAVEKTKADLESKAERLRDRQKKLDRQRAALDEQEARINLRINAELRQMGVDLGDAYPGGGGSGRDGSGRGPRAGPGGGGASGGVGGAAAPPSVSDAARMNYRGQLDLRGSTESGSLTIKNSVPTPVLEGPMGDAVRGAEGSQRVFTPVEIANIKSVIEREKGTVFDWATEYWYNAILMAPGTQTANIATNAVYGAWEAFGARFFEAMVNSGLNIVSKDTAREGAQWSDFGAMTRVLMPSAGKAWRNAVISFNNEMMVVEDEIAYAQGRATGSSTVDDRTYRHGKHIRGRTGRILRLPTRLLRAADEFFKGLWAHLNAAAFAMRQANGLALQGEAAWKYVEDKMADLSDPVWFKALHVAKANTFQSELADLGLIGKTGELALALRRKLKLTFVIPFVGTPTNIAYAAMRYSPLVTLQTTARALSGDYRQPGGRNRLVQDIAKNAMAWGIVMTLASALDKDDPWLTGTNPRAGSVPPLSVRIGGKWHSYATLEPFASVMAAAVDGLDNFMHGDKPTLEALGETVSLLAERVGGSVPMLTGIADLANLAMSFAPPGERSTATAAMDWASNFTASWVPNILRRGLAETDDVYRTYSTLGSKGESGVMGGYAQRVGYKALGPLASAFMDLPPAKHDVWGEPIKRSGPGFDPVSDWAYRVLLPTRTLDAPVGNAQRMNRVVMNWNRNHPDDRIDMKPPRPTLRINGEDVPMNAREYETLVRESGRSALKRLSMQRFDERNPTEREAKRIRTVLENERKRVRDRLVRERRRKGDGP